MASSAASSTSTLAAAAAAEYALRVALHATSATVRSVRSANDTHQRLFLQQRADEQVRRVRAPAGGSLGALAAWRSRERSAGASEAGHQPPCPRRRGSG